MVWLPCCCRELVYVVSHSTGNHGAGYLRQPHGKHYGVSNSIMILVPSIVLTEPPAAICSFPSTLDFVNSCLEAVASNRTQILDSVY